MSLLLLLRPLGPSGPPQPPSIISFAPPSGPIGTVVVLTGSSFTGATDVSFNGVPAISFIVDADSQITVTVPVGATDGLISVTTPIGTGFSATPFDVTQPVVIVTEPPAFTGAGGITEWHIQIPRLPQKKKMIFRRNMENQDREDLNDLSDILKNLN